MSSLSKLEETVDFSRRRRNFNGKFSSLFKANKLVVDMLVSHFEEKNFWSKDVRRTIRCQQKTIKKRWNEGHNSSATLRSYIPGIIYDLKGHKKEEILQIR